MLPRGSTIIQGYIPTTNGTTVRVRIADGKAFMAIKIRTSSLSRHEHEFPIPVDDAREILTNACPALKVEKTRYLIPFQGMTWELDIFHAANEGLVVAEIELEDELQQFATPPWVGEEVTHDERYSNSSLAIIPYSKW